MSDVTEEVTDAVVPDEVTEVADSTAHPETEPGHESAPDHSALEATVRTLENRVGELTEAVAGLSARIPAPESVTPDDGPSHDSKPVRKPWTHRGFKRHNVVE